MRRQGDEAQLMLLGAVIVLACLFVLLATTGRLATVPGDVAHATTGEATLEMLAFDAALEGWMARLAEHPGPFDAQQWEAGARLLAREFGMRGVHVTFAAPPHCHAGPPAEARAEYVLTVGATSVRRLFAAEVAAC